MGITRRGCITIALQVFLLVLIVVAPARAQPAPASGSSSTFISISAQAAITAATLQSLNGSSGGSTAGFLAGVSVTPNPNALTWQVDVQFHQKGGRIAGGAVRSAYLEALVMLRANLRPERRVRFHLLAGVSPAYRLRSSFRVGSAVTDLSSLGTQVDVGVAIGAGVNAGRITVGARFIQGLRSTGIQMNGAMLRNRVVAAVMAVRLN